AYLAFVGQKGKSLLLTGGAFTFGVFLTYLLIGLGLLKFLTEVAIIKSAAKYIYFLTALLAFAFEESISTTTLRQRRGRPKK
ncbi:hypothetical protein KKH56_02150, partial [bacterium]|nr:hypothetical protein [bacterium]